VPDYPMSWKDPYINDPNKHQRFGYLTSLSIGGLTLAADQTIFRDPTNPSAGAVAALENVSWDLAPAHPMPFSAYVSTANAHQIRTLLKGKVTNNTVKFVFTAYEFDEQAKKWFQVFSSQPRELTGLVAGTGGQLALHVGDEGVSVAPNMDVIDFNLYFEVTPPHQSETVTIATRSSKKSVYAWSV
jgi:hypothetical protein